MKTKSKAHSFFGSLLTEISREGTCLKKRDFEVRPEKGIGNFTDYSFGDVYIGISNLQLLKEETLFGSCNYDALELSFLIEGSQVIRIKNSKSEDLIYESQQCYAAYISCSEASFTYGPNRVYKEIKIRLGPNFIKKHSLNNYFFEKDFSLSKSPVSRQLTTNCSELLYKLLNLSFNTKSLLYLESIVTGLLAYFLEAKELTRPPTTDLLGKLYYVENKIKDHLSYQYTLAELAALSGLNEFVLKKEFKRVFTQTVMEYANQCRMVYAEQLLQTTTLPIYEISESIGYKNATHFSAAFKRFKKITPLKFRKTQFNPV